MSYLRHLFDGLSIAGTIATLAGWLPHIAALLSVIWGVIRIYETRTVQGWLNRRRK